MNGIKCIPQLFVIPLVPPHPPPTKGPPAILNISNPSPNKAKFGNFRLPAVKQWTWNPARISKFKEQKQI